jgi:thiol-disulfide isomerase/thioredoxin
MIILWKKEKNMSVQIINDSNYQENMIGKKAIVKFYADWCGSCRLFAPKFQTMSENEKFSDFIFLKTNAEENPEFRATAEVSSLPYFAIYENGKFVKGLSTAREESLEKLILGAE